MNHISSTYDAPASFPVVLGTSCEFCQSKPFCCTYQLRDPSVETRALFLHWLQSCEDPCCVQLDNKHCKLRSYECLILSFHVNRILVHELSKTLFTNVHHRFAAASSARPILVSRDQTRPNRHDSFGLARRIGIRHVLRRLCMMSKWSKSSFW